MDEGNSSEDEKLELGDIMQDSGDQSPAHKSNNSSPKKTKKNRLKKNKD